MNVLHRSPPSTTVYAVGHARRLTTSWICPWSRWMHCGWYGPLALCELKAGHNRLSALIIVSALSPVFTLTPHFACRREQRDGVSCAPCERSRLIAKTAWATKLPWPMLPTSVRVCPPRSWRRGSSCTPRARRTCSECGGAPWAAGARGRGGQQCPAPRYLLVLAKMSVPRPPGCSPSLANHTWRTAVRAARILPVHAAASAEGTGHCP